MKNIFKYSLALLTVMLGFTACSDSDDNYVGASISGPQVFFDNSLQSQYEISSNASSFDVTVSRGDATGALEVPLSVSMSEGSIFTVPTSVNFADGETTAKLTVSYDPNGIEYGKYDTISVSILDPIDGQRLTTPYGLSSYTFMAGATAWVSMGQGMFRDGLFPGLYDRPVTTWAVEIQKNVVQEGLYRVIAPYGSSGCPYIDYFDGTDLSVDIEIDATDPEHVYFGEFDTGIYDLDPGDGHVTFLSFVQYYLNRGNSLETIKENVPEYFGKLEDGVITFSTPQSCLATINGDGYYYANSKGMLAIALPGYAIADYTLSMAYVGRFTDAANVDYARLSFTFGSDVEQVKYAIVPVSEDVDAVAEGIEDGSVEAYEISASGTVEVPVEASGSYNVVAVLYAAGKVVGTEVFKFKFQSSGDTAETWTPLYVGTYVYGANSYNSDGSLFYDQVYTDEGITLYQSDSDSSRYRIAPWCASEEVGLVFTMDDDGVLVVDEVETGEDSDYGMICATDFKTYGAADMPSYYEDGVFHFYLAYHVPAGVFAYVEDTFTPTGYAEAAAKRALGAKVSKKQGSKKHLQVVRQKLTTTNKKLR